MTEELHPQNLKYQAFNSIANEVPLWSAPFGLRLLEAVNYKNNICALDIGCGSGFPLIELAMRLGSASKVYGLDPDPACLERITEKKEITGVRNIELVEGVAEKMPFNNGMFDLIISNNGINNVQDLTKCLSECGRVSKAGAQLAFTYNTADTFAEFYRIFRTVIKENGLPELEKEIESHIRSKRKPLAEYEKALIASGYRIKSLFNDSFSYKFCDGTSMLDHYFIKNVFSAAWKEIVPQSKRDGVFKRIEEILNDIAGKDRGITMSVPFTLVDCERK